MKTHRFAQIAIAAGIALTASVPAFSAPAASLQESTPAAVTQKADRTETPRKGERGDRKHGEKRGDHRHHRHHAAMHGGLALHGITLTDDQKAKIGELRKASAPQLRESTKQAMESHKALRELALSGNFDEARAKALAQEGADAMARVAVLKAKADSEVVALLTPEQRKEMAENAERNKERMQQRMKERQERKSGDSRRDATPAAEPATTPAAPAAQ